MYVLRFHVVQEQLNEVIKNLDEELGIVASKAEVDDNNVSGQFCNDNIVMIMCSRYNKATRWHAQCVKESACTS